MEEKKLCASGFVISIWFKPWKIKSCDCWRKFSFKRKISFYLAVLCVVCDDVVYNCAIHFQLLENSMRDVIAMVIDLLDVQLQYLQKGLCCCLGFLGKGKRWQPVTELWAVGVQAVSGCWEVRLSSRGLPAILNTFTGGFSVLILGTLSILCCDLHSFL